MSIQVLRRLTVARKLTLIIMATTGASLLVACFCAATYDVLTVRERMVQNLSILAELMGSNSTASLTFQNPTVADEVLSLLKAHPNVVAATTYDANDQVFARYVRHGLPEDVPPREAQADGHYFEDDRLVLFRSIQLDDETIGTVLIESDLDEISDRMWSYLGIVAVIMLGAMTLAFLISSRLQRVISQPLLALSETASRVTKTRDYALRAEETDREDEIGGLVESFNEMLEQIEERDEAIRRANEELAQSEKKALEATDAKSSFLANMSHELRTPLNSIIGFSEVLLGEVEGDDAKADLDMIHAAGKHLLTLINGILDLSKIEAGKMELYIEPYEMSKLIQEVQRTIDPLVQQRGNTLQVVNHDAIGTVNLDITKLRQCLLNLLSNANKFTDAGTVSLEASRTNQNGKEWIELHVSDTGIGMSPAQVNKLFQPFTQADSSTSRRYGGTGLGLTISKRFCELMGGTIGVSSTEGEGTTFTIRIPYDPVKTDRDEDSSPVLNVDQARTVLVIDDSKQVHTLMVRFLSDQGWTVVTAANGPDGIRMARQLKPAVITLDVMMDGMDGWAVLSKLKGDLETAEIPVVMLSIIDDKRMGYALGASDYITKPIDRNTLSRVLSKYRSGGSNPVLVVDDDSSTRNVIHRMLDQEGWQVVEAANGREAMRRMEEQVPRLVLLDLMMPEMNGFEFIDEMRERDAWREVPVIVVSGHDISTAEQQQLNGCVKAVIQKNAQGFDRLLGQILEIVNLSVSRPAPSMEAANGKPKQKSEPQKPKRSLRVLLADDNRFNQRLAVRILQGMGHSVVLADHGREAVEKWEQETFDLVLMDVQMPEMDGFEATTAIREKEEVLGRHTPIVAMTAHAMVGYREKCIDAGMDDYIAKPIQVAELAAKINACMPDGEDSAADELATSSTPEESTMEVEVSINQLRKMAQGDEEFMKELICDFLIDTSNAMKSLDEALDQQDAASARRAVHSIKGLSASVGAASLSGLAGRLEDDAAAEKLEPVRSSLDELRVQLEGVQNELRKQAGIETAAME